MGDPTQPDAQGRTHDEAIETTPGMQERLLCQILCHVPSSGEIQEVAVDAGIVLTDEAAAGLGVTLPELLDQQRVGGERPSVVRRARESGFVRTHVPPR